jgi:hypothetical protein
MLVADLLIQGDPTLWSLAKPFDASTFVQSSAPESIDVLAPLAGTLLLSVKAAGSVAVIQPPAGAIPTDYKSAVPFLYLPKPAGFRSINDTYPLPASTNLANLMGQITGTMDQGSRLAVELDRGLIRALVLNGATLPFVVVCPANVPPASS